MGDFVVLSQSDKRRSADVLSHRTILGSRSQAAKRGWHSTATLVTPEPRRAPMTVGVVDESQLFRECVAAALEEEAAYCVTFQASSLEALQQEPPAVSPDVLLAACGSLKGNTAELIRWAAREMPGTKVLVLGSEEEQESEILDCIEAGASGLISRGQSLEDLKKSLAALASGETLCSPRLAQSVFSRLKELAGRRPQEAEEEAVLTARELEILELVADGLSNKEIAKKLIISLHTVKNHVHNILEKLEVSGRYAAVTYAYDRRWLRRRWQ